MSDTAMLGASRYAREPDDFYRTPAWVTEALLRRLILPFNAKVWEPAAGDGAILDVLEGNGLNTYGSDLNPQRHDIVLGDFLEDDLSAPPGIDAIITNPPFKILDDWARATLRRSDHWRVPVALLARQEWDCAAKRWDLTSSLAMKIVLTSRPIWFPDRELKASPRHNYAWYVWKPGHTGPAQLVYEGREA
ncbi:MAG: SAM-dependent methyltransferase [Alphaproteobacteria bacterium]|nr:SAM-dependent methyltransferase [Alphaproteobacteria bacterium]